MIAIGVGGLEAENVMLGRASWMRLPDIVGCELTGKPQPGITATDIVLAITEYLRKEKVVGAYLEFFGEGASALTLGDRATISNMTPEFGATAAMTLRGLLVLVQLVIAAMMTAPSGIWPGTSSHGAAMPRAASWEVGRRLCGFDGPAMLRTTDDKSNRSTRSYSAVARASDHRPASFA